VDAVVRRSGLEPVYWTVDAGDLSGSAEAVVARALTVEPGGIILLHEGAQRAVAAVPGIVDGRRKRGLCPGFLARSRSAVMGANGRRFAVVAVKP
jgi:peptidoglycan/xylan/chitin deacetylase (PgdA/CDA1 family)